MRVTLQSRPNEVLLHVEDSGPGIPSDERERVFDRFYRRVESTEGGSGLGLAIARDIAARHQASILLNSSQAMGGLDACVCFGSHA